MFHCPLCGSNQAKTEYVNEVFQLGDCPVLVEHIPALVCQRCGEESFSRETTEQIRRMVHGEAKPVKSVLMNVFVFEGKQISSCSHGLRQCH